MSSSISAELAHVVKTTSGTDVIATVPAGHLWIHRYASMAYFGTSGREVAHAIKRGSADFWLSNRVGMNNNDVLSWAGWQVLEAGDSLEVFMSATGSLTVWMSGTDVTL